jgi:hypothetical protein
MVAILCVVGLALPGMIAFCIYLSGFGIFIILVSVMLACLPLLALRFPKHRRWAIALNWILTGLSLGWAAFIYYVYGDLGFKPMLGFYFISIAITALAAAVCTMVTARAYRSRVCVVLLVLFLAAFPVLQFTDYTPMKPFLRFQHALHNGMTEAEVFATLRREFPQNGRFAFPEVYFEFGNISDTYPQTFADDRNPPQKGPYTEPVSSFQEGRMGIFLYPLADHGASVYGASLFLALKNGRVVDDDYESYWYEHF